MKTTSTRNRKSRTARAFTAALGATLTAAAGVLLLAPAADARPHHKHGHGHHHHGHKHHGHHGKPPAPQAPPYAQGPGFGQVTVAPDGPGRRLVTVETIGSPMSVVEICDLSTPECVDATFDSGRWVASIPAPDPDRYSVGFIGRSGSFWVTGNASSNPPAEIPPPVNIG